MSLPASMFGKVTFFLLRAKGESMMEVCGLPYLQMKVLDMGFWQIDFGKDLYKGLSKAH